MLQSYIFMLIIFNLYLILCICKSRAWKQSKRRERISVRGDGLNRQGGISNSIQLDVKLPSLRLFLTCNLIVGRLLSFWQGLFSGAMLVSGRVLRCLPHVSLFCKLWWESAPFLFRRLRRFRQKIVHFKFWVDMWIFICTQKIKVLVSPPNSSTFQQENEALDSWVLPIATTIEATPTRNNGLLRRY